MMPDTQDAGAQPVEVTERDIEIGRAAYAEWKNQGMPEFADDMVDTDSVGAIAAAMARKDALEEAKSAIRFYCDLSPGEWTPSLHAIDDLANGSLDALAHRGSAG